MKLHPSIKDLLAEIDAYSALRGLSPTQFGKVSLNDEGFVHDLRRGRNPRFATLDRVRAFMRANDRVPSERAGA
jgi:hypothetical protein